MSEALGPAQRVILDGWRATLVDCLGQGDDRLPEILAETGWPPDKAAELRALAGRLHGEIAGAFLADLGAAVAVKLPEPLAAEVVRFMGGPAGAAVQAVEKEGARLLRAYTDYANGRYRDAMMSLREGRRE